MPRDPRLLLGLIALAVLACSTEQRVQEAESLRVSELRTTEERQVTEYSEPNILETVTAELEDGTLGRLSVYSDAHIRVEVVSDHGYINAIDYNNDGRFDKVEARGTLRGYANDVYLNSVVQQIYEQRNRKQGPQGPGLGGVGHPRRVPILAEKSGVVRFKDI